MAYRKRNEIANEIINMKINERNEMAKSQLKIINNNENGE
jgi:hypothetical protein